MSCPRPFDAANHTEGPTATGTWLAVVDGQSHEFFTQAEAEYAYTALTGCAAPAAPAPSGCSPCHPGDPPPVLGGYPACVDGCWRVSPTPVTAQTPPAAPGGNAGGRAEPAGGVDTAAPAAAGTGGRALGAWLRATAADQRFWLVLGGGVVLTRPRGVGDLVPLAALSAAGLWAYDRLRGAAA